MGDGVTPVWILTCLFFVSVLKTGGENWDGEVGDCRRRASLAAWKRRYLERHHLFEDRKRCLGETVFWGTHLSDGLWGCWGVAVMECWVPALHGLGKKLSFSSAKPWGWLGGRGQHGGLCVGESPCGSHAFVGKESGQVRQGVVMLQQGGQQRTASLLCQRASPELGRLWQKGTQAGSQPPGRGHGAEGVSVTNRLL